MRRGWASAAFMGSRRSRRDAGPPASTAFVLSAWRMLHLPSFLPFRTFELRINASLTRKHIDQGPSVSTTARVLLGLLLGAAIGLLLAWWNADAAMRVADVVQPIGRLWLNALQMTVVPLVAALVVLGVNTASDAAASGRTARTRDRAVPGAADSGAALRRRRRAAAVVAAAARRGLRRILPRRTRARRERLTAPGIAGRWFAAIIPSNAFAAAAQSAMLPLVVFALFFGFALTRIETERRARMLDLVQAIADVMIVIVRWVLWAAPLGVFALVLAVCARVGRACSARSAATSRCSARCICGHAAAVPGGACSSAASRSAASPPRSRRRRRSPPARNPRWPRCRR